MKELIWKDQLFLLHYLELRKTIALFHQSELSLAEYLMQEAESITAIFFHFCETRATYFGLNLSVIQEGLEDIIFDILTISPGFVGQEESLFFLFYDSCYQFCLEYLEGTRYLRHAG